MGVKSVAIKKMVFIARLCRPTVTLSRFRARLALPTLSFS